MKGLMSVLAFVAVACFVGGALLAAEEVKPVTWEGVFVKLDGAKVVLTVKDKEKTVLTDDKTVVTLDGKAAKLADLKAGMPLVVTLPTGKLPEIPTAVKIEAKMVPMPKAKT